MPAPIDPFDFAPHTAPRASDMNLRFKRLYDALDKTKVGLDAKSFKDGAFTGVKFPAVQAWQTVALQNSTWAPANLSYYKDAVGLVHLRPEAFTFGPSNIALGTLLATLPAGYRPGVLIHAPMVSVAAAGGAGDTRYVVIDTDGTIKLGGGSALGSQVAPAAAVVTFCDHGFRAEN